MRRVFLRTGFEVGAVDIRAAALALGRYAVDAPRGRVPPDPVHEWITEGRRLQYERAWAAGAAWARALPAGYSSCGDLAHWLLLCLGVRDERYVNRDGDGGTHPWLAGVNISRLVELPAYVRAIGSAVPSPGDIVHLAAPDHVAICEAFSCEEVTMSSFDYGQPYGGPRTRAIVRHGSVWIVGGRALQGWVDIERLSLSESALVPDDFEGGEPDGNPYPEDLTIPGALRPLA